MVAGFQRAGICIRYLRRQRQCSSLSTPIPGFTPAGSRIYGSRRAGRHGHRGLRPGRPRREGPAIGPGQERQPAGPAGTVGCVAIMARLVEGDAEEYVLLTSLDISAAAAEVTRALDAGVSPDERRAALRPLLRGTAGQHLDRLTDAEIQRLGRCRVSVDHRSRRDLRDALLGAVRDLRRRDGRGIGETSGGLLLDRLHWEIHRRAASPEERSLAMSDVRDVLRLNDHALAQALWDRDWEACSG